MAGKYPQVEQLRELRYSLSKLRLNDLAVGADGRNRASLWAYGTKTARNAPGASEYIFGPAKWIRHLITPPPGRVLVHRDYAQQEVRIAAVLSGDEALLAACESDDVYLGIAGQLGFLRESMSAEERAIVRVLFKIVVLGIQYGLGYRSLAVRTGISHYEAREILARLRARSHKFEEFASSVLNHAGLRLEIETPLGCSVQQLGRSIAHQRIERARHLLGLAERAFAHQRVMDWRHQLAATALTEDAGDVQDFAAG
jgi:hypothetical protein